METFNVSKHSSQPQQSVMTGNTFSLAVPQGKLQTVTHVSNIFLLQQLTFSTLLFPVTKWILSINNNDHLCRNNFQIAVRDTLNNNLSQQALLVGLTLTLSPMNIFAAASQLQAEVIYRTDSRTFGKMWCTKTCKYKATV